LRNADAQVRIEIPLGGMEVRVAGLAPAGGTGRPLSLGSIKEELEQAGVVVEPDAQAVAQLIDRAQRGLPVRGTIIARGVPPRDGEDGKLELFVETEQSVGTVLEDGRINFYERSTVHQVERGQLLARVAHPGKGVPGRDVFGKAIPAKDGRRASVSAGANVAVSQDGLEFRAKTAGRVVFVRDVLSVTEALEVPGDVDFSSGNIRMEHGGVTVKGTIRGGFTVISGGDLVVGDAIENATVQARGDIRVGRGIVARKGGCIKAGGSVSAVFAENATIEAEADLVVHNDISNCDITVGGKVIATKGKGRIQGGTVQAGEGVEANQIGSALSVRTVVIVGKERDGYHRLIVEKKALETEVGKIEGALGTDDPATILQRTPVADREALARSLERATAARQRIGEIEGHLAQQVDFLQWATRAHIEAKGTVYPGTILVIAGCRLDVRDPISSSQFYYDPESDSICATPL